MKKKDLLSYDYYVVAFSGGKDSMACVLHLIEQGVPREKIELWHHSVDGREGSTLMDWPCTEDYCKQVAEGLEVKIYFSWKVGGIEREMTRQNASTAPIAFEYPHTEDNKIDGAVEVRPGVYLARSGGTRGKLGTRMKFPQVQADLRVRWCSAYVKIDVGDRALRKQPRFTQKRTLFVTGERAEESKARSKYSEFEPHRADLRDGKIHKNGNTSRRHVDAWRPIHKWDEQKVWDIMMRHKIQPHPAYLLGWGRLSCMTCIFGSKDQWASVYAVAKDKLMRILKYEKKFRQTDEDGNVTFNGTINRKYNVLELAKQGKPYEAITKELVDIAMDTTYRGLVFNTNWVLPAGAFGDSTGPT